MDMVTKINNEIKARNLTNMKQCKVGVEIHFKDGRDCPGKNNGTRRRKRSPCGVCWSCSSIEAS